MSYEIPIPAFPNPALADEGWTGFEGCDGMELRDYFAAKALAGMVAGSKGLEITVEQFAGQAYKLADAMMAARKGGTP